MAKARALLVTYSWVEVDMPYDGKALDYLEAAYVEGETGTLDDHEWTEIEVSEQ